MKYIIINILTIILCSCYRTDDVKPILTDNEWKDALEIAVLFAEINSDEIFIYSHFDNKRLKYELQSAYLAGSEDFGYAINDSISDYIIERRNSRIRNRFDSIMNIRLVEDTVNLNEFILLSEPFYIDNDLLC